jgi:hypothetical protein
MLTVKLFRHIDPPATGVYDNSGRFTTRVVEAEEVDIHTLRADELKEIAITSPSGKSSAYYVIGYDKPAPAGFAPEITFWAEAFVENAQGSTVAAVRVN